MRRSDIQGLRAIGALLVAVFHIFQWGVSGGVDVFLTVSGFFLWSTAVKLVNHEASYFEHYKKFLKRTAPQSVLVVFAVLITAFVFLSPVEYRAILKDATFSVTFIQNYWLAISGQDYLAREEGLSLFQHYWAVSTIAQVYCLFPVLAFAAVIFATLLKRNRLKTLTAVIAATSALSLAWSLFFSSQNPDVAYFDTLSRIWQFGAGALVASLLAQRKRPFLDPTFGNVLSWVGLVSILTCGILLGRSFPGVASLWPTTGALLILLCSRDTTDPKNAGAILSQKWAASLGSISFGIYLWHWPIYAIYFRYQPEQTLISAICIIAAAAVLALLSGRLIAWLDEAHKKSRLGSFGLSATAFVAMCLIGGTCFFLDRAIVGQHPVIARLSHPFTGVPLSFTSIRQDLPVSYGIGCHQLQTNSSVAACSFGDTSSDTTVFLIGGSHSAQWLPAFREITQDQGFHLVSLTKSACRFFDSTEPSMADYLSESCREWNLNVMQYIIENTPDMVVTLATTRGDESPVGFRQAIEAVAEMGVTVVALRDTPSMQVDIPICLSQFWPFTTPDCRVPRSEVLDDMKYSTTVSALPETVISVDINDEICPSTFCDVMRGDIVMWRDYHHLTATYARTLSNEIWDRIAPQL